MTALDAFRLVTTTATVVFLPMTMTMTVSGDYGFKSRNGKSREQH
jgi:hypothetical protein